MANPHPYHRARLLSRTYEVSAIKRSKELWLLEVENPLPSRQSHVKIIIESEVLRTPYGVELIAREALRKGHFEKVTSITNEAQ